MKQALVARFAGVLGVTGVTGVTGVLGMLWTASCTGSGGSPPRVLAEHTLLHVEQHTDTTGDVLRLVPETGARINAQLVPALELRDTVLYFGGDSLTADGAYFAAPPTLQLSRSMSSIHGTLRASVCPAAQRVCVIIELPVSVGL